ncbi:nucleolin isoform X2 [Polypterus senegalus]|nr:nucleolin isoform X2 [Polypterus senegalus]
MVPQPKGKGNKLTPAKANKAAKNGKLAKKQQEEEEEEDDDDEEDEDESDDSEDEEPAPTPKKGKATPVPVKAMSAKKATPAKKAESSEEEDDDDDEEATVSPPKKATPAKQGAAVAMTKKTPAPKAGMKVTPAKSNVAAAKKATPAKDEESEEEDEDEDDSEEDSEEEEAMDTTPALAVHGKKAAKAKPKDESEEEEDDDDDDDDDDEEEDEEEAPQKAGKRKKPEPAKAATPPAKKAKSEGESFALFVGNLNTAKSFEENKDALRSFFTKKGLEVQDIRIGFNKKFGYVDFASEEQLLKALEFNGKKVLGQEIRLDKAKSKDDPSSRKERDSRTLFVKNLPFSSSSEDLKELFPNAVDVRMPCARDGSSRGIAYIEFKTEAETQKMMKEKQGTEIEGRAILLDFIGAKSNKTAAGGSKTLVVNNLAYSATEDSLQSKFEKAVSCRIPQNNGRSRGFAFVEFESAEDAKEALDNLNNTEIEGRTVRLEFCQGNQKSEGGRGAGGPTKTLFVRGLSEDTTDQTLKDSFDGAVAARIATDKDTGSSKGFGFVDFDTEEECKAAKEAMEDCEIDGSKVTLDFAKPKGDGQRGGRGGGRGGRGGFGRGGFRGRGGSRGGFGGRGGGFGGRPQGKKIKFDD